MYTNVMHPDGLETTEAVQLEDGSTLLIQEIPKFLDGHTVQLEDGTTAFVHPSLKAGGNTKLNNIPIYYLRIFQSY
jgi:hypothetical protein